MIKKPSILTAALASLLIMLICYDSSRAEELPRPIVQNYRVELSHTNARSSYLSPLPYSGKGVAVSAQWSKASRLHPENMVMDFKFDAQASDNLNPAKSAQMYGIDANLAWGLSWRKRWQNDIQTTLGGSTFARGGALYLTRNGNNPVTALGTAGVNLNGSASWHSAIGDIPILITDALTIPSLSLFFSPQYGETYYEIYLGNQNGIIHPGWWGNNFGINNLLSCTFDFGHTAFELGYRYERSSYYASNLFTMTDRHSLVIGVIPFGIGLRKKAKINSPLY